MSRVWHSQLTCVGLLSWHVWGKTECVCISAGGALHWNNVCAVSDGQCQLTPWVSNQHSSCLERSQISTVLFRMEIEEGEEVKRNLSRRSLPNLCLRWSRLNGNDGEELPDGEMLLSWWQKAKQNYLSRSVYYGCSVSANRKKYIRCYLMSLYKSIMVKLPWEFLAINTHLMKTCNCCKLKCIADVFSLKSIFRHPRVRSYAC